MQLTSYRDLDKAYAFLRDSMDEQARVATDHPEFYGCITGNGMHRAPLPILSDRETLSFRDEEDAIIARLDGETDEEDTSTMTDWEIECELRSIALDDADDEFGTAHADDREYDRAWRKQIDRLADALSRDDEMTAVTLVTGNIFARRHVIATTPKGTFSHIRPATSGWKNATTAPTQFLRHAHRAQRTFRRAYASAA